MIVNGALAYHRGELPAERGQPIALRAVDSRQGLDERKDLDVDRRLGITLSS